MTVAARALMEAYGAKYAKKPGETLTLDQYLEQCRDDKMAYASAAEHLLHAIGGPELVYTEKNERLSRIYGKTVLSRQKTFKEFYGMDETIIRIVGHIRHTVQGLEESKQILYLLGPAGSAKSSLAEKVKELIEQNPVYVFADENSNRSPINGSPLGLFKREEHNDVLKTEFGIESRYLKSIM